MFVASLLATAGSVTAVVVGWCLVQGGLNGKKMRLHEMQADMAGYTAQYLATAIDQDALDQPLSSPMHRLRIVLALKLIVTAAMIMPTIAHPPPPTRSPKA